MTEKNHTNWSNSDEGHKSDEKLPKVNWLQHATAINNFSCQDKFLSSSFLFSLEPQKPPSERAMGSRFMACQLQNFRGLQSAEVEKAWHTLSSLQISSRNYIRPGVSIPVEKATENSSYDVSKRSILERSSDINKHSEPIRTHQNLNNTNVKVSESARSVGSFLPSHYDRVAEAGKDLGGQDRHKASVVNTTHRGFYDESTISDSTMHTSQIKESATVLTDDIDDDEILENIDVDQIVMEHYQSAYTPQPSISKLPPITPTTDNYKFGRQDDTCLPPELCSNCTHGFKLGLCPEATGHIQEMKDRLIAISNELLDNADLSPVQIEKLRQDRLKLNKEIQQLERYLLDMERQKSHFSASTATGTFQYETPQAAPQRIDPMRFDAQVHLHNESRGFK